MILRNYSLRLRFVRGWGRTDGIVLTPVLLTSVKLFIVDGHTHTHTHTHTRTNNVPL